MSVVEIGSYTHGTLRSEDLIDAALCCLIKLDKEQAIAYREEFEAMDEINVQEHGGDLYEEITNKIDALLPPYLYWGCTEGDGSDIGIWPSHDSIQEAIRDKELRAGEDWPEVVEGDFLHISDHGNMEYYVAENGKWVSQWSCV